MPDQQPNPQLVNLAARQLVVRGNPMAGIPPAVDSYMALNPIVPANATTGTVINVQPKNVGLLKKLIIKITATITAGAASVQTLTPLGLANLLSNVTFTDLANNQRINTYGWHLNLLSSVKRGRVFGAAYASDTPNGYGNIFTRTMYAPTTIAALGTTPIVMYFEVPIAYSDDDLRGAIYSDVVQAVMQLQMTFNNGMFVTSTGDPTLAVYQSAGADLATISAVSVQVYQQYLQQLPRDPQTGIPIWPRIDTGTGYMINSSVSTLPVANQDNALAFTNARQFQSFAFVYDNNGVLNIGTDINSISVASANMTFIQKLDPVTMALMARNQIGDDLPKGTYYLDFRRRPIDTNQYGNMQVIINPLSVGGSAASFICGWESFGIIGLVNQGGAIPSGA